MEPTEMIGKSVEEIVREEIETVRARQIILDHLEGGLQTGAELREKITTDIKAQMVLKGASKREIAKVSHRDELVNLFIDYKNYLEKGPE